MSAQPMASYTLKINADSGYSSTTEGRCTPEQYGAGLFALMHPANPSQVLAQMAETIAMYVDTGVLPDAEALKQWLKFATDGAELVAPSSVEAQQPMTWPKSRDIARLEDMSPSGHLRLTFDSDNDVCVEVYNGKEEFASVEFCNGGGGGGKSPHTRAALIALMVAIERDNTESPYRAHPRFSGITKEGGQL